MRALGFEPKKAELSHMITEVDKDGLGITSLYDINFVSYHKFCLDFAAFFF